MKSKSALLRLLALFFAFANPFVGQLQAAQAAAGL